MLFRSKNINLPRIKVNGLILSNFHTTHNLPILRFYNYTKICPPYLVSVRFSDCFKGGASLDTLEGAEQERKPTSKFKSMQGAQGYGSCQVVLLSISFEVILSVFQMPYLYRLESFKEACPT